MTPNSFGLYDMHGNVSEWCYDFYGDYTSKPQNDPTSSNIISQYRIRRGGGFYDVKVDLRSSSRSKYPADMVSIRCGFRLAKTM